MNNIVVKLARNILAIAPCFLFHGDVVARLDEGASERLKPKDFAFGADITIERDYKLQLFELPQWFYSGVSRLDIGDFRIFNSQGRSLHYKLLPERAQSNYSHVKTLPIFPIYVASQDKLSELSFQLNTTTEGAVEGTVIDVQYSDNANDNLKKLLAYIVDNSRQADAEKSLISSLEFEWSAQNTNHIDSIRIEKSNNLNDWNTVKENCVLSRVNYAGEKLDKNTIIFPAIKTKYFRISWSELESAFEMHSVKATFRSQQWRSDFQTRLYKKPLFPAVSSPTGFAKGGYQFNTDGRYLIEQISLVSNGENNFYKGVLYSRPSEDFDWMNRARFIQYQLKTPGGEIKSKPVQIVGIREMQWLIKFETPFKIDDQQLPSIEVAWLPGKVMFLAQGKPPYRLAFGNPNISAIDSKQEAVVEELAVDNKKIGTAYLGEYYELGGSDQLIEQTQPFDWKVLMLWVISITGVLLMLVFAFRLYKK